jgi:5-formyltetrahydrofolate cyclo-ligase
MPAAVRIARSDAIWKRLVELEPFQRAGQALFFVTHGSEVETETMRRLCRELGMGVGAPRCEPASRSMRFHVLPEDESLSSGPYGIAQPAPDTVVLVPGAVFDRSGNRLGYGSGFYDRWLAGEGRGLVTVALAFHEQVVRRVPVQPWDVPVRWLVTDREVVDCAAETKGA